MKDKKSKTAFRILIISAGVTFLSFGNLPHDQLHPLYTVLSFLPLQLGALMWIYLNGYLMD